MKNRNWILNRILSQGSFSIRKTIIDFKELPCTPYLDSDSFAFGNAGILYGLDKLSLLDKYNRELIRNKTKVTLKNSSSPISITRGELGILYSYFLMNPMDLKEIMNIKKLLLDNKNTSNYSLFNGLSGMGIVALNIYNMTNDPFFRDISVNFAYQIINKEIIISQYYGLGYGNTGIALFLLKMIKAHLIPKHYLKKAKYYLIYDYKNGLIKNKGQIRGVKYNRNINIPYIYLPYGSAGLIKVMIEYLRIDSSDKNIVRMISVLVKSLDIKATLYTGYYFGVSGIISMLEDVKTQNICLKETTRIQNTLINYLIYSQTNINDLIIFPADQNFNAAIDYGSGELGILLVIQKLLHYSEFDPLFI